MKKLSSRNKREFWRNLTYLRWLSGITSLTLNKKEKSLDFNFVPKTSTNALMYVNTTSFSLLHCYMFQSSRGHPQGVLIDFVSRVNKMRVQMQVSGSQNIFTYKLYLI
jgi:hypothetical protein